MPLALAASSGPIVKVGLLVVLWGLSIAAVYWDLNRQAPSRAERLAWLAAVVLLPGAGLVAYLLFRFFGRAFPLAPGSPRSAKRRVTQLRQAPAGAPGRTGTILAADLVQETVADRRRLPQRFKLAVTDGPHAGQEFVLDALPARLGRGGEAALRLDRDLGVSRQHAEIYRQDGLLRIRDLESSHGVLVNGVAVHDKALEPGDKIQVGLSTLVVKEAAA
jgi:hypothetical protein